MIWRFASLIHGSSNCIPFGELAGGILRCGSKSTEREQSMRDDYFHRTTS
jgi:hypothetical protein